MLSILLCLSTYVFLINSKNVCLLDCVNIDKWCLNYLCRYSEIQLIFSSMFANAFLTAMHHISILCYRGIRVSMKCIFIAYLHSNDWMYAGNINRYDKLTVTMVFTRGQFWPPGIVVAPVRPSVRHQVCPRDNSSPVQARITKFGPKMQNTLVKVPFVLGVNQPWPSRSNLRSKSKFTPFWACLHHNSSSIRGRITKFGPEVQNTLVKSPIVLGGNWPRPWRSNLT